jgi:hypothetical protein
MIDWEAAFAYYALLPAQTRTYAAVGSRFGVSRRTVERHGQQGRWRERVAAIEAEAARETDSELRAARVEQISKLLKLIDASLIGYADKLRRGEVRMTPADLERLHRLWRELGTELGETDEPPTAQNDAPAARTPEHIAAVLEALQACGALDKLGLRLIATPVPDTKED